jgi:hypothetical protein
MIPGGGDVDYPWPAYDSEPSGREDEGPELRLTREDAPRDQAELFQRTIPGRPNAELLIYLAKRAAFATVSDYLNQATGEHWADGGCITCWNPRTLPSWPGARIYCTLCGTHTVCRASDIAIGDTPGPVKEIKP